MALGGGVADATQGVARADSRRVEGATGHVRKRLDSTELQPLAPLIMEPMTPLQTPPTDDACYLAFKARDARFEGCFFTGVTSTRIYCRPVCRVRTARRENCRFFAYAAQAEQAVRQVAALSGFASVRRFNAAFVQAYTLNPTRLRLKGVAPLVPGHSGLDNGIHVRLAYRPPYDTQAMLQFLPPARSTASKW